MPMSAKSKTPLLEQISIGIFAVFVALAFWYSFPRSPTVFNDDFGYYRSIAATIQHGWPWTDDWLGPWAASLSVISALIFEATGNFRMATYGLVSACAGVIVFLSMKLLRHREVPLLLAAIWALIFLSSPSILRKLVEFGAVPLYLGCLLGALWSAERKNWTLFGICWFIAFANRQSALLWLALPAGMAIESSIAKPKEWLRMLAKIAGIGAAGGFIYLALSRGMNKTHGQSWQNLSIAELLSVSSFLHHFTVSMGLFVASAGLGAFVLRTSGTRRIARRTWKSWTLSLFGSISVAALWALDAGQYVSTERILLTGSPGATFLMSLGILAVVGWLWAAPMIHFRYLACGLAMSVLMGIVPEVWDYYLIDIFVFGIFSVALPRSDELQSRGRLAQALGYGAATVLLANCSFFVTSAKRILDSSYAKVWLCERALRAQLIEITDITAAPFGFRGWHLHPYFIANDAIEGRSIAYFRLYVREDATWCRASNPENPLPTVANGGLREDEAVVVSYVFPAGWTKAERYTLFRTKKESAPLVTMDLDKFVLEPFPLNNKEWREYLGYRNQ